MNFYSFDKKLPPYIKLPVLFILGISIFNDIFQFINEDIYWGFIFPLLCLSTLLLFYIKTDNKGKKAVKTFLFFIFTTSIPTIIFIILYNADKYPLINKAYNFIAEGNAEILISISILVIVLLYCFFSLLLANTEEKRNKVIKEILEFFRYWH